ncbi:hypothetical protein D3C76_1083230 [compost metagenome]
MNLPHLQRAVDRRHVQQRHQATGTVVAGIHQHLGRTHAHHLKTHRLEIRHLGHRAGQLGMGVATDHFPQHPPGHALAPILGLHCHVRHAAGLGVVLHRQVQHKARYLLRVVFVRGDDQLHGNAFFTVQRLQVQVHLIADRVLIEVVQQVAGRDRDHADVGQVVDHHLQDLAIDVLGARGLEVADQGHCGDRLREAWAAYHNAPDTCGPKGDGGVAGDWGNGWVKAPEPEDCHPLRRYRKLFNVLIQNSLPHPPRLPRDWRIFCIERIAYVSHIGAPRGKQYEKPA